ncbi:B12-binding domain-containing radical SAM protein [Candidatus Omnitrophota bacterium]
MKVLLVSPPKPKPLESPLALAAPMMPLGLGFIAAALEQKGHQVLILDDYLWRTDYVSRYRQRRRFRGSLKEFNPDFVGFHTHSVSFQKTLELIELVKNNSQARIICGGPHAFNMPESFPSTVDFIVLGEGEFATLDIVEGRVNERIVRTNRIEDLEELPMPAWHLFEYRKYKIRPAMCYLPQPVFNLNTSRGCPFNCRFCSMPEVWGRKYKMFSAQKIVREIEYLIRRYKIRSVYFREDNFTVSKKRIIDFCNLLIEKNIKIDWACETRVDTVDGEMMQRMKISGCNGFYIGVESGSQKVLDNINKGITVEQIINFFARCKELRMRTYASLCFGTPGEKEEDRVLTEELIKEIRPDRVSRAVYVGTPKSEFYNYLLQKKQYYYIDDNGFLYPNGYRELAMRYYGKNAKRYIP